MKLPRVPPRYDDPPVVEVVMSVQFEPIDGLTPVHLGRWERAAEFEHVELKDPVNLPIEALVSGAGGLRITFSNRAPGPEPATWFTNKTGTQLLQIQPNRFARNWTRGVNDEQETYPSWAKLAPDFDADWHAFRDFLATHDFAAPVVTQCEITYINPITRGSVWNEFSDFAKVIALWSGDTSEPWDPPDSIRIQTAWQMDDNDGAMVGRLHADARTAVHSETHDPVVLLQLTARGTCGPDPDDVARFLQIGHDHIVAGFTAITTRLMHDEWGRTQ